MRRILKYLLFFYLCQIVFFFPSDIQAATYNAMTFNYRWVKPHNMQILSQCLRSKNIDFAALQEVNFYDGTNLTSLEATLRAAGYQSVNGTYSNNRLGNLTLIYKNTYIAAGSLQEHVIGGGINITDDTRKIVSIQVKDPATNQNIYLFNLHPIQGNGEPSCTQVKSAYQYVQGINAPYNIFMGDFNVWLNNTTEPNKITSCNALTNSLFSVSCRPGITSKQTTQICGGKSSTNQSNIDFVLTPLTGKLLFDDSYFDRCGFSIGATDSFDSDHVPLFATLTELNVPTPTPTSNIPTATPTITLTPTITPTATPTPGPRMAECNACGYCLDRPAPDGVENCMKCLYPNLGLEDSLRIDLDAGRAPQSKKGAYYTQIGCIDVGSFSDPQAAGTVLTLLLNRLLFPATGVLSLLALIYGSFLLVTSQDNPEQIQKGRLWIMGAIVGTVFTFGAILLVQTVGKDILKIPGIN